MCQRRGWAERGRRGTISTACRAHAATHRAMKRRSALHEAYREYVGAARGAPAAKRRRVIEEPSEAPTASLHAEPEAAPAAAVAPPVSEFYTQGNISEDAAAAGGHQTPAVLDLLFGRVPAPLPREEAAASTSGAAAAAAPALPRTSGDPSFAYKEVVRGAAARAQLRGFDCPQCAALYEALDSNPAAQLRTLISNALVLGADAGEIEHRVLSSISAAGLPTAQVAEVRALISSAVAAPEAAAAPGGHHPACTAGRARGASSAAATSSTSHAGGPGAALSRASRSIRPSYGGEGGRLGRGPSVLPGAAAAAAQVMSRHRGACTPPATPPGYWDLGSLPSQDDVPVAPYNRREEEGGGEGRRRR